jgi:glycosyltransferase involved in cell wall biosynthesis
MRARYGKLLRLVQGFMMWGAELLAPNTFPGRRAGVARTGLRFLRALPHFLRTREKSNERFHPHFAGWSYADHRDGAFHAMASRREAAAADFPLVSILVRTCQRPQWLRQAITSCANQTYPNLEVIVVEDGPDASRAAAESFAGRIAVRYQATGERVGRARAGNLAMQAARGEWMNFLDDDDVLFADHVEVLVRAAREARAVGAFGFAWESHTRVLDRDRARYEEISNVPRLRHGFDRVTLWHENYLPIQAVMFHRSLFEHHGGFAEDMDQLEDWNLWTRYTLKDDFVHVEKTTSKYRVPADAHEAAERQARLDAAYRGAVERQRSLQLQLSARDIAEMADAYARNRSLGVVARTQLRRVALSNRAFARVAAWRRPTREWLRRRGLWQ